ncbi:MAG: VCBS repeat-containing protein [Chloracidobacterium sp.]|nr:VCBS repeat-containing protein [Chloracidobacterium sp.]
MNLFLVLIYAGIADINLDGKQDVLTANRSSNNVTLRLGDGTGGFGPAANFAVGSQPFQLAVGDINGDGKPDVTTADYLSDQVSVLLGDGLGRFTPIATYPVGSSPIGMALGYFNGDGRLDPVTANSGTNLVSVLINECQTICTASPAGWSIGGEVIAHQRQHRHELCNPR